MEQLIRSYIALRRELQPGWGHGELIGHAPEADQIVCRFRVRGCTYLREDEGIPPDTYQVCTFPKVHLDLRLSELQEILQREKTNGEDE